MNYLSEPRITLNILCVIGPRELYYLNWSHCSEFNKHRSGSTGKSREPRTSKQRTATNYPLASVMITAQHYSWIGVEVTTWLRAEGPEFNLFWYTKASLHHRGWTGQYVIMAEELDSACHYTLTGTTSSWRIHHNTAFELGTMAGFCIAWRKDMPTGLREVSYCRPAVRTRVEPSSPVAPVSSPLSVMRVPPSRNPNLRQRDDGNERHWDKEAIWIVGHPSRV